MAKRRKAENNQLKANIRRADTSTTGQEEAQRHSSDVGPDPKIRWSAAYSSSSCHREFCIQPELGKWNFLKAAQPERIWPFFPR